MKHYSEDELTLYYYGEGRRRANVERHLGELRAEHQLVGVAADVAFEMSRCAGSIAAFEALGGQCEGVGFGRGSRCGFRLA